MVRATHRLIAKVSDDLERWSFNTAVAACMEYANELQRYQREAEGGIHRPTYDAAVDALLLVLAPMAPHMTAEAWERRHHPGARVHAEKWPSYDAGLVRAQKVTMVIQVDGKLRDRVEVSPDIDEEQAISAALASPRVKAELGGAEPARVIARPPRLVNVVR
jgi:leucyl-tRNA synthetase